LSLNDLEDDYHNLGCDDSQIFGCALSLLSWGTPYPPAIAALDLSIDHTNLEYLVTNNTCSNLASSFTHHLHQLQQPQEQYLALEKLYQVQSAGLGGMEVSESNKITNSHPLEQSTQLQHAGGTTSCNFLSSLGGLGLDAANSMLEFFQSNNELEGIPSCGVSRNAHQISKATSDLVHTPSLQVHHHQHHFHEVCASVPIITPVSPKYSTFLESLWTHSTLLETGHIASHNCSIPFTQPSNRLYTFDAQQDEEVIFICTRKRNTNLFHNQHKVHKP
jgi:hypothetical protein